jgi:hypothetical protein
VDATTGKVRDERMPEGMKVQNAACIVTVHEEITVSSASSFSPVNRRSNPRRTTETQVSPQHPNDGA